MPADIETIENYLTVPQPESIQLVLDDSRRITGPGMIWDRRGALIDVLVDGFDSAEVVAVWEAEIARVLSALGWDDSLTAHRIFENGVTLLISAPADLLYSAVFVIETGWHLAACRLLGQEPENFGKLTAGLKEVIALEKNPALIRLQQAADARNIDILSDDDFVSLGHGKGSEVWGVNDIPDPSEIDWNRLHNLPVALITGTNGKSTSVRLATAIGEAAGLVAGSTSTDYVKLGNDVLDYGDYSGPGGARMLLRDKRLEIAFLETARGGILRRGLPLFQARAALVTNIAADHLGQYGVNTVEALAQAKFAVARAVSRDGVLVLNADDPLVVVNGEAFDRTKCWFSLSQDNTHIRQAREAGDPCCWYDGENICYFDGAAVALRIAAADIPITMGGSARFNIHNIMGAIGLSRAMGIDNDAIVTGLTQFTASPDQNPGRCNEFMVNGARVFVDFAHNPHAISAMSALIENLPANRKYLLLGHAGDRSDQEIRDLTRGAVGFDPDLVVIAELEDYLRGREPGEVPALIASECTDCGIAADAVRMAVSPGEGTAHILGQLRDGDVALILALSDRDRVFELIRAVQD
ncbi:Mur ligase family protein [Sphingorhabdus sp. Alg239-R122]|uniref:Mur ligase family protein n=1 Tax=Sphingorhabdus sp. Alg239-R122 TaxID=2305989 RepID=UPI0013DA1497|nr:Mur ligase family protein [Sphingorhabdus sp. Alg239-R122]